MMYRLGQQTKFRRLRRLRYHKGALLSTVGVPLIGLTVLFATNTSQLPKASLHSTRPTALHGQANTADIHTGSAKPAGSGVHVVTSGIVPQPVVGASLLTASCTGLFSPETPGLASASNSELQKLAQYQQVCGGQLAARSSFFVPTPATVAEAQSYASDTIATLEAYAQYHITPLVFMEPDNASGNNLDLTAYSNGAYDAALDTYFADIKAGGVTDAMMGMWVMLPEGNLPEWTSVNPTTFATDVTKVAQFQKKYFPTSQTSIMLDSESYPSATSWNDGAYVSLLPYVQGIPKGLIDSFGLQGFPWAPPANQGGSTLYDPAIYLRTDLAAAAARSLGVSSIWLNTGTFNQMYAGNSAETVTDTPQQRETMLDGVVAAARGLQSQGFTVSVHLFAQDKASDSEGTDWSYWQTPGDSPNTNVFATFVHDLTTANIPLWIFDTY